MSSYDEYLEELKAAHSLTAKECLERLYHLLKLEDPNMSKDDMYDRIVKDCLVIWSRQTILNNMPDELKDPERQEVGKKNIKKRQRVTVTNDGSVATVSVANNSPDKQKEQESTTSTIVDEMKPMRVINVDSLRDDIPTEYENIDPIPNGEIGLAARVKELEKLIDDEYVHKDIHNADLELIDDLKAEILRKGHEVKDAIDAANKIAEVAGLQQPIDPETGTNKDHEIAALKQLLAEKDEIIAKGMKVEFNTASTITAMRDKVEFPANLFTKFFVATRNTKKQALFLKISDGKVQGWEE